MKEINQHEFKIEWKKIFIAALIIWLNTALSFIDVNGKEQRFFENNVFIRLTAVFLLVYLVLSFDDKYNFISRFASTTLTTLIYYLLIEV